MNAAQYAMNTAQFAVIGTVVLVLALTVGMVLAPNTTILVIGTLCVNLVIGCTVLALVDDDQQSLFRWASACPLPGGYTLIVELWPVVLWFWLRRAREAS